ncbi:hypothetical protein AMAG_00930 [Allomyces macrogynus ATCC 38327]|uniref:Uncharacterized protein n=1 Tax=Allomyces macrogynus (strain ATCC 38327) TaxID=578462 RepID=A0A0L0RXE4_ALLM3|nr:hypothetical protein AMAG_00930 [Allomyces macrogynus ATCC 38327]|eukprot:KNE54993.1 hypothetical protein AMAG_00930 [Allomyces macrogynus ATCC 38327]
MRKPPSLSTALCALALLAAALLALVTAAPTTHHARHHDAHRAKRAIAAPLVASSPIVERGLYLSTVSASQFLFSFQCERDAAFCQQAERTLDAVGRRLSTLLDLGVPVTVNLSLFLPCGETKLDTSSSCSVMNTLGFATPARSFPLYLPASDARVDYPQALLRQLQAQQGLDLAGIDLAPFDIIARFNSLFNWYFPTSSSNSTSPTAIAPTQFDMELILQHELLHGLGFGSLNLAPDPVSNLMLPVPIVDASQTQFLGWRPSSAFEMHLSRVNMDALAATFPPPNDTSTPPLLDPLTASVTALNMSLARTITTPANLSAVESVLAQAPTVDYAALMYTLATTNDTLVVVAPESSTALYVETGIVPYASGSSLGHVAMRYRNTPEFLMIYALRPNTTLAAQIMATGAPPTGVGPRTMDLLKSLGYRIRKDAPGNEHADIPTPQIVQQEVVAINLPSAPLAENNPAPKFPATAGTTKSGGVGRWEGVGKWWPEVAAIVAAVTTEFVLLM